MMLRFLLIALALPATSVAADRVSDAIRSQFRAVSAKALKATPDDAIALYEDALKGPLKGYGRVHLQLGELYQDQKRWADAAYHFKACDADSRVESIDRELVCQGGFKSATAPLEGLPRGARARLIEPRQLAGPVRNGDRVPRGTIRLEVTVGAGKPQTASVRVDAVARWQPPVAPSDGFIAKDDPKRVPDGFIADPVEPGFVTAAKTPVEPAGEAIRWPAFAAAGVGAALLGTGLAIGLSGRSDLDDLRARQANGMWQSSDALDLGRIENDATTADILLFSGAGLMASAVALWFIFDAPSPDSDDDDEDDDMDDDSDEDSDEAPDDEDFEETR